MRPRILVAAACALAALPGVAIAPPTITEFSAGITPGSAPRDIVAGPDGALWFTGGGLSGNLGRITTTGSVSEHTTGLSVGGGPWGITAASDGNLWFTENALVGGVGRATTLGAASLFTAGLPGTPALREITEGPDGNLWATAGANPGYVVRITPTGTITSFGAGIQNNATPSGITAGPDGNIWFTEVGPPARIGRITPAGVATEFETGLDTQAAPDGITAGPDGNLWFTHATGIGRITPAGVITSFTEGITPGSRPSGIVAGTDGNLWFTEAANPGRVGRITTNGTVTEYSAGITPNSAPTGIAAGPDGNIWFTERLGDRIGRVLIGPDVTAGRAGAIDHDSATVTATVRANSQATSFSVEFGPTASYGRTTAAVAVGASADPQVVSATLDGLDEWTTYHFRTVATNDSGTAYGPDRTFTTLGTTEPPQVGKTVVAGPVSGTVRVRVPGTARFVALSDDATIPVGAVVDVTRGRIKLVSAIGTGGALQSAVFWGGAFQIRQSVGGNGTVDLHLRSAAPRCAPPRPGARTQNALPRPVARRLWGKDHKGRYRTHGRNSVATVRGTVWSTVETCRGTLTQVRQGAVSVRDLRRSRTILVRAGGSYLAARRR